MGQLFRFVAGRPVVEPTPESGCWVEVLLAERRASICRLELDLDSPLTPRSKTGNLAPRSADRLELKPGVWWYGSLPETYLVVRDGLLAIASKAEAYRALGAVEALKALGLDDAAISLEAGEFDLASVQVIAERDRRK